MVSPFGEAGSGGGDRPRPAARFRLDRLGLGAARLSSGGEGDAAHSRRLALQISRTGSRHGHGVGLGASRAKWRFLPAAHTDFIFAVIGEELGLVGTLLVVGLFLTIAYAAILPPVIPARRSTR